MQAIAIALAVSLVLGPAATEVGPADASVGEASDVDVTADPDAATAVEPSEAEVLEPSEAEPEPEVEPEPAGADQPAPAASTVEATPLVDPAPIAVRDRLGCDGSKRCRRMTVAGIVVGTLGVIGVGAGIGLLVNRDKVIPEAPVFVTSTRPAGLVMLTVSSGVAFTAILMLVAAHKGYKHRPDDQARIRLTPTGLQF